MIRAGVHKDVIDGHAADLVQGQRPLLDAFEII